MICVYLYMLLFSDVRMGNCFNRFSSGRCVSPRPLNMTKADCCCTQGQAWGSQQQCAVCPTQQEGESKYLLIST